MPCVVCMHASATQVKEQCNRGRHACGTALQSTALPICSRPLRCNGIHGQWYLRPTCSADQLLYQRTLRCVCVCICTAQGEAKAKAAARVQPRE